MLRVYLVDQRALAYLGGAAMPDFWDRHWQRAHLHSYLQSGKSDAPYIPVVKSIHVTLAPNAKIAKD